MKNANDFINLVDSNEKEARELTTKQVSEFTEGWHKNMSKEKARQALMDIPMEEFRKIFADVDMAIQMLIRAGFDVIEYEEEQRRILWKKKVTPGHIVIMPRQGRYRRG